MESTGQLQTKAPLDYETKDSYTVTVTATDPENASDTIDVTITVTNVEEAGTVTLSNNQPSASIEITATLTDPDDGVTGTSWQWAKSSDGATVWVAVGTDSPSYTPADGDVGHYLRATASYTDGHGPNKDAQATTAQAVEAGANRPPEFSSTETGSREVPENTAAGESIGAPVTATDPDTGDTLTYTLGVDDAASFDIDESTGQLQTKADLDYETTPSYTVTVSVRDSKDTGGSGDSEADDTITVTVTINNVDEDGTVTLSSVEPQVGASLTATLEDPDGDVTGEMWQWARASLPVVNSEWTDIDDATSGSYTPVDADLDKVLRATASYTDPQGSGKSAQGGSENAVQAAPATNNAPVFAEETDTRTIDENTAAGESIGDPVTAADPDDGDTLTYTLGGDDAASFDIDASTGQLQTKADLDYETKQTYTVTVTATDPSDYSDDITVTITITDVKEPPSVLAAPAVGAASTSGHNRLSVSWQAPDDVGIPPITGYDVEYRKKDAMEDWGTVNVTVSGVGATITGLTPNTRYEVQVRAKNDEGEGEWSPPGTGRTGTAPAQNGGGGGGGGGSGGGSGSGNRPPEFGTTTATREVPENTGVGEDIGAPVAATDPESNAPTYTLGGTDAASFDIVDTSGQLRTKAPLDHETKDSYTVTVTATDPENASDTIDVTITVTDVNEAPEVTGQASINYAENGTEPVHTYVASDPESNPITWSLTGADSSAFSIGGGALTFVTPPGYEAAADANNDNDYLVTVEASDGTNTESLDVTVTITDVNEPPSALAAPAVDAASTSGHNTLSVSWQAPDDAGIPPITGYDVEYRKKDAEEDWGTVNVTVSGVGATITSLTSATRYEVQVRGKNDEGEGEWSLPGTGRTRTAPAQNRGGGSGSRSPANKPPVFTEGARATRTVAENTAPGQNIGAPVAATDPESNAPTYTLGGTDAASFDIVDTSGQLQTKAPLDYETKDSYTVSVIATDPENAADTIDVTITVTNVDEAGTVTLSNNPALGQHRNDCHPDRSRRGSYRHVMGVGEVQRRDHWLGRRRDRLPVLHAG